MFLLTLALGSDHALLSLCHLVAGCPEAVTLALHVQQAVLFGTDQGTIRLLLERNADQMSLVAHYIHLCFEARKSDESHLAPQPGLYLRFID